MRFCVLIILAVSSAANGLAQLSIDQKMIDFQQLAALYTKQYGPYEWKRDVIKFDLLDLRPWLDRISKTESDLEFYEVLGEYVASLQDAHSEYFVPSSFVADSGIRADLYDGKVLIEAVDRSLLPRLVYPFDVGDEIVSVDGKTAADWIKEFNRFQSFANQRSTERWSAQYIPVRVQAVYPRAAEVGDTATFVIRRQGGDVETYEIDWQKSGRPLVSNGPVPNPRTKGIASIDRKVDEPADAGEETGEPAQQEASPAVVSPFSRMPAYLQSLLKIQNNRVPKAKYVALRGFGARTPIFSIPAFTVRIGRSSSDFFYSGTFSSGGYRIGYIRIPTFQPLDFSLLDYAYAQFDAEIAYLKNNTDGLVVDVMRNPGGYGCYAEELLTRLMPRGFNSMGFSVRPSLQWVNSFHDELELAKDLGAEQWQIDLLTVYDNAIETAFSENRGLTGALPLCTERFERDPARDAKGAVFAYDKPMILLVDDFTTSAGDLFAALFQDAKRGPLVGWRTAGAGGSVVETTAGFYSEGSTAVTQSLMIRPNSVVTSDFPESRYVENIGVRPEVTVDYMTMENLKQSGRPFVDAFTKIMVEEITKSKK